MVNLPADDEARDPATNLSVSVKRVDRENIEWLRSRFGDRHVSTTIQRAIAIARRTVEERGAAWTV